MAAAKTEVGRLEIQDRDLGLVEVRGRRVGMISTRRGSPDQDKNAARWSVNQVWKLPNGSYLLIREALSLMYHTEPTSCRNLNDVTPGEPAAMSEMRDELERQGDDLDDAIACEDCEPDYPEDLAPGDQVRFEFPRRFFDECANGQAVMKILVRRSGRASDGSRGTMLGRPARALLEQCRENDPDFYTAEPVTKFGT